MQNNLPDLFDYSGPALVGKFISPVYFASVKELVESFYKDPSILKPESNMKKYFMRIREWIDEHFESCPVIRPFALLTKEYYLLVLTDSVILGDIGNMFLLKMRASMTNNLPKDPQDISATDDETLQKYLEIIK